MFWSPWSGSVVSAGTARPCGTLALKFSNVAQATPLATRTSSDTDANSARVPTTSPCGNWSRRRATQGRSGSSDDIGSEANRGHCPLPLRDTGAGRARSKDCTGSGRWRTRIMQRIPAAPAPGKREIGRHMSRSRGRHRLPSRWARAGLAARPSATRPGRRVALVGVAAAVLAGAATQNVVGSQAAGAAVARPVTTTARAATCPRVVPRPGPSLVPAGRRDHPGRAPAGRPCRRAARAAPPGDAAAVARTCQRCRPCRSRPPSKPSRSAGSNCHHVRVAVGRFGGRPLADPHRHVGDQGQVARGHARERARARDEPVRRAGRGAGRQDLPADRRLLLPGHDAEDAAALA